MPRLSIGEWVRAMDYLLYEHEPKTPEEIDAFLRSEGVELEKLRQDARNIQVGLRRGAFLMRFRCDACGKEQPKDDAASNKNWSVYRAGTKCDCGGTFRMTMENLNA